MLISYGININHIGMDGLNALTVFIKDYDMIKLLIQHNININIKDSNGNNAFSWCMFNGMVENNINSS